MTDSSEPRGGNRMREVVLATALLNGVMMLAALSWLAVPVLAPAIAADIGTDVALVGTYSAILWGSSIVTSVAAGHLIARHGAFAMAQACLVVCAIGLLLVATGMVPVLAMAAILIGLAHGVETPASSTLLARITPPSHQPIVFSVKQTGVQIGGIVSGFLYPLLAQWLGWRASVAVMACILGAAAIALNHPRRRFDAGQSAPSSLSFLDALRTVMRHAKLRALAFASFAFIALQISFNTFLVSFLVTDLGHSLAVAGGYLAAGQAGGLVGRLLWGAVSGRWIGPLRLLALLGLAMFLASGVLGAWGTYLPGPVLGLLCFAGGLTMSGWNGVFLAEVARLSPKGEVARITGATFLIGSCGLVAAPLVYSVIASRSGFGMGYVVMAFVALAGTITILASGRARGRPL